MANKNKSSKKQDNFKVVSENTPFVYLEAIKSLRTNIEFVTASNDCKVIMFCSALAGEGKTTLSINLAISLAQDGKKVLLMDCDLRRPKIQHYLRIKHSSEFGVSTVLSGSTDADCAIGFVEEHGIYVMLSGPTPPNPTELLTSERSEQLFEGLRSRFDYIICDTPPVSIVADAAAFSKYMDGAVIIVRQNFASRGQINETISRLNAVNTKILGTVLNDYDFKSQPYYKYSKYKNYHSYYANDR